MQNVGQQIEGTLKKKKEDEDRKAKEQAAANILMSQVGLSASDAAAAVKGGMADTVISMNMQKQKMDQDATQFGEQQAVREAALGQGQQRVDIARAAETRQAAAGTATLGIAEREIALKEKLANAKAVEDPVAVEQAAAELRKTQMETAKIVAQTDDIGKGAKNYDVKLLETKVGDVTFAGYLQELTKTKKIKGGELHQKGLLNFDEDQIAAFDNILRNNTKFLKGMPKAVQDYYGYTDTPGGGSLRITKR